MYNRPHFKLVKSRILEKRKFIQVIIGPRQVGKSTLINQVLKSLSIPNYYISADASGSGNIAWLDEAWNTARLKMDQEGAKEFLLVVDEIQKIENWSEIVKFNWDNDTLNNRNLKIVLLGSSRLHLQMGLTESLAGRFETIFMGHWSLSEMQDAFGWTAKQYVWFGGFPGSAELIHDEKRWKSYVANSLIETSISKDILMLTRVDKPALMKGLFELGCLYSGQILSFTKIIGQHLEAGNTTTLAHYLELLNTAGLLAGLQKYSQNIIKGRGSSPKFQVHNTAFISAQRNEMFNEVHEHTDLWGRLVESSVGAHLINNSLTHGYPLYYWRNGNDEIDFVIDVRGKIIGLEIKSGNTGKITGMNAFQKQMKPDKVLLISNSGLSWEEFLKMDVSDLI
jgi:uncharacterized protein